MSAITFTCKCCQQPCDGPEKPKHPSTFWGWLIFVPVPDMCVMCQGHQGNILKLESEHAADFKQRLADADAVIAAGIVERGDLKRRIVNLERDRDRALDSLALATVFHKRKVPYKKDCVCGLAHCQTCNVGVDPWVYDHIQARKARKTHEAS